MLAGLNNGPGKQLVAWNSALIYDMIFTQPVVYEFGQLKVPTTLLIGDADTTAIGKDVAPPEVKGQNRPLRRAGKRNREQDTASAAGGIQRHGTRAPDGRPGGLPSHTVRGIAEELNRSTPMQKRRSWNPSSLHRPGPEGPGRHVRH
jgi:hypothetical protein